MKNFRYLKTYESWSRRKVLPNGMTALIEFWEGFQYSPYDYGIAIATVPKGRMRDFRSDLIGWEEYTTGDGSLDAVPFYLKAVDDFIAQNPGIRIIASASDDRRAYVYKRVLSRRGFMELPRGIEHFDWAMMLDVPGHN